MRSPQSFANLDDSTQFDPGFILVSFKNNLKLNIIQQKYK